MYIFLLFIEGGCPPSFLIFIEGVALHPLFPATSKGGCSAHPLS